MTECRNGKSWVIGVALAVCGSLVACGDGPVTIDFPVAKDKQLKDLTADERKQVCEVGLDVAFEVMGPTACAAVGLAAALGGQQSCKTAQDTCLTGLKDPKACDGSAAKALDCDTTIGEAEQCMNDLIKKVEQILPNITCSSSLTDLQGFDVKAFENLKADSCEAIEKTCPEFDVDFGSFNLPIGR